MTPESVPEGTELPRLGVAPIRRMRLVDEATRLIRDMILAGKLRGGTRLRQVDLAGQLGISRTPLREALMKLEQEGLIAVLPSGGLRVVELDAEGAIELYEIREVLDGLAARLCAERMGKLGVKAGLKTELKALEGQLKKMEGAMKSGNPHNWFISHHAFHEEIFRASGNSRVLGLSANVRLSIQRFHQLLLTTPNRLEIAFAEHQEIYNAIKAGDPVQAEASARRHIANARNIVVGVMEAEAQAAGI